MSWLNDLERDSFKKPSGYATRGSAPRSRGSFSRSRGSSSQKFTNRDNKENRISMDYNENKEMDNSSGANPPFKRYKKDESADPTNPNPSLVIHVRNLSSKATEADLLEALSHFGHIAYATVMPVRHMALVEFETLDGARACVVYAQSNQIYVAGQPALFNYSTSQAIQRIGLESEVPNHILVLTVYNVQYPINVEIISQICKPHGEVRRIAIIRPKGLLQTLVEFDSIDAARRAKYAMNGADIYSGCCTLKVEFAKVDRVKVTRNDNEQWDYTIPPGETNDDGATYKNSLVGHFWWLWCYL
uniref:RRM domain-containing protein n=1 Tax=Acrobeloides nanus TaxID=290746 RepID=A0A914C3V7_9BILA